MDTTRRSFLGGFAVATALSSVAAAQAVSDATTESAELLALGTKFDAVHARFLTAIEALTGPIERYRLIAPALPQELIAKSGSYAWQRGFTDFMIDPADPNSDGVVRDGRGTRLYIVQSYRIESCYGARFGKDSKPADFSNASEWDVRLYERAKDFEQQISAATDASGLTGALAEHGSAKELLRRIIWDLCEIRARTPAGIALKVRATAAYAAFGSDERLTASNLLSRAIWEDMGEEA